MKPAIAPGRPAPTQRHAKLAPGNGPLREHVRLSDLTDCLLSAYDGVARLAYEKFRLRGEDSAGNELADWLDAESELLGQMEVNIVESGNFVNVLASVPGYKSGQISLGLEPRWMLIFGCGTSDDHVDMPSLVHAFDSLHGPPHIDAESLAVMCAHAAREQSFSREENRDRPPAHLFCICELPAEVDPATCTAILSNGLLGIRIAKVRTVAHDPLVGVPTL